MGERSRTAAMSSSRIRPATINLRARLASPVAASLVSSTVNSPPLGRWPLPLAWARGDLLALWDVDYTLVSADGLGTRLYEVVFREMFGRELTAVAPKAGRTDRAIIGDTLALAGVSRAWVDAFLAALARAAADGAVRAEVRPLAGASDAVAALASAGIRQSVLTGNVRPLAALKLRLAGLGDHLDLDVGAYGDVHEVRAELVAVARQRGPRGLRNGLFRLVHRPGR